MWFANRNISTHSVGCLFTLLLVLFDVQKCFSLIPPIYLFFLSLLVFWGHILKIIAQTNVKKSFYSAFVYLFYTFRFYTCIQSILSCTLYIVWDKGPVSLFCIWMSTIPNIIYWRNYPFPIICFWHPGQISFCHRCGDLFLSSILFHWYICLLLHQYHTILMTVALKFKNMMPPALFFFNIALVICCLYEFHKNFRMIFCFYKEYLWGLGKNCIDSMDNFIVLRF